GTPQVRDRGGCGLRRLWRARRGPDRQPDRPRAHQGGIPHQVALPIPLSRTFFVREKPGMRTLLRSIPMLAGGDLMFRHFAWLTVFASLALSLLGVYIIDVGVIVDPGAAGIESPLADRVLVVKQVIFIAVGILAAAVVALPSSRFVRLLAWPTMW